MLTAAIIRIIAIDPIPATDFLPACLLARGNFVMSLSRVIKAVYTCVSSVYGTRRGRLRTVTKLENDGIWCSRARTRVYIYIYIYIYIYVAQLPLYKFEEAISALLDESSATLQCVPTSNENHINFVRERSFALFDILIKERERAKAISFKFRMIN